MSRLCSHRTFIIILTILLVATLLHVFHKAGGQATTWFTPDRIQWSHVRESFPVDAYIKLPTAADTVIPTVQATFKIESIEARQLREQRRSAVKEAFIHSWRGYKSYAWMQDEVAPLSQTANDKFGGWGATLVDSLDTLWILGLVDEFEAAVHQVRTLDFSTCTLDHLNVFETTIRFLGGLLGAYDVSGQKYNVLLDKAVELGDMLYHAFDTPNRMPITRWDWRTASYGSAQEAESHALLAEVGSMTLEFTRLSQLTGDPRWYDAVASVVNVLQARQNNTRLPGLWPRRLDMQRLDFGQDPYFDISSMSDSTYEYLPKMHILLGGSTQQYRDMYTMALTTAKEHLFFRPLNDGNDMMLLTGTRKHFTEQQSRLIPESQHLSCFAGGMVGLAAKVFQEPAEMGTARKLLDGCLWAYESMPSGIMPEAFTAVPCVAEKYDNCTWSEQSWHVGLEEHIKELNPDLKVVEESIQEAIERDNLPPGMSGISDSTYNLRPEAIESMFIMYRITGDAKLQNKAWSMFQNINNMARTDVAYAAVEDVGDKSSTLSDSMESFWLAETLKYFYLMFSEPDLVSLDQYVFNTEAHPFLRPK